MPVLDGRDSAALDAAAERLAGAELLAFPTETVYGLGARADDDVAVGRIFAAKDRPATHPLIVHIDGAAGAAHFAAPGPGTPAAQALMDRFWPGPLTLILPRRAGVAQAAAAGHPTIGLRVPSHPVACDLLRRAARLGVHGVAAPSANRHGRVSPTTAQHVADEFGAADLWVLDGGPCAVGIESAIVDCSGPVPALLRPGALDPREIERVLGRPLAAPGATSPRAPGTLASHYAPAARVVLFDSLALLSALAGLRTGPPPGLAVYSRVRIPALAGVAHRTMPNGAEAAAHELFAVLREFDAGGALLIWVERPPPGPDWDGVRDRLQRAAAA